MNRTRRTTIRGLFTLLSALSALTLAATGTARAATVLDIREPYPVSVTGIGSFAVTAGPDLSKSAGFSTTSVDADGVSTQARTASPEALGCSVSLGRPAVASPTSPECAASAQTRAVCQSRLLYTTNTAMTAGGWVFAAFDVTPPNDPIWSRGQAPSTVRFGAVSPPVAPWFLAIGDMNQHRIQVFGKRRVPTKGANHCQSWASEWVPFPLLPTVTIAGVRTQPISTGPTAVTIPAGQPGAGRTYVFVLNYVTGLAATLYYTFSDPSGSTWSPWRAGQSSLTVGAGDYYLGEPSVSYWQGKLVVLQNNQDLNGSYANIARVDPATGSLTFESDPQPHSPKTGTLFGSAVVGHGSTASSFYATYYDKTNRTYWVSSKIPGRGWGDDGWFPWFSVGPPPAITQRIPEMPAAATDMDLPSIGFQSGYDAGGPLLILGNRTGNRTGYLQTLFRTTPAVGFVPDWGPWTRQSTTAPLPVPAAAGFLKR